MPTELWTPAYVGLGSNLDDPREQVVRAANALATVTQSRVQRCSLLYSSSPMGPRAQPDYVNAVVALLTLLTATELHVQLQRLERKLGRKPTDQRWGPRRIDLDLLLCGDTVHSTQELILPHPGLTQRAFVLQPLADVAPQLRLPGGPQVGSLLRQTDCSGLTSIGELAQRVET